MERYGTTREQLAHVSVKNHRHGAKNPEAQYPFEITVADVLGSVMVADPLRILDCSPITDGAAAVVLCPLETARKISKQPVVKVLASAQASDTIALHARSDMAWLESTAVAAQKAYKMAGRTPQDIDVAEVHDCFSIAEILRHRGARPGREGPGRSGGRERADRPRRQDPGQHQRRPQVEGPPGRSDRRRAGRRSRAAASRRAPAPGRSQGARLGLTQNMGGTGGSSVVHILEAV